MLLKPVKDVLSPYYRNLFGWRTSRRLLVVESDDWGSIRMPSRTVYEKCLKDGYPVDQTSFERYDSLLSDDDLDHLFDLLKGLADAAGRRPVLTANVIMSNPDFAAIRENDFKTYQFEPLQKTFARYPKHARSLEKWKHAIQEGFFFPQFHGREHLNVERFMAALRANDPVARFAFDHEMPGCIPKGTRNMPNRFVETTRFQSEREKEQVKLAQVQGLEMFKQLFGFSSRTLTPTNYVWSEDFDSDVMRAGVEALQGVSVMSLQQNDGTSVRRRRVLGARTRSGQTNLVRNAFFEPSSSSESPMRTADKCLYQVAASFRMRKPAVISSHRVNFCGFIDSRNRDQNLRAMDYLLRSILKRWPDVEFISSVELLDIIDEKA